MDGSVSEGKVSGGSCSEVVRPRRPRSMLITDSFSYGRTEIPEVWGNYSYGPAPPTGTGTGTGTFKPFWDKPKEQFRMEPSRREAYSFIDGKPWYDRPTRPGSSGKTVREDPVETEEHKKLIQELYKKAEQHFGAFDLWHPRNFQPYEFQGGGVIPQGITYVTERDRNLIAFQLIQDLKFNEERFKRNYSYGIIEYGSSDPFTGSMEARNCLTVTDGPFFWMLKSSGIKWVGIYGINALCVVTLAGDVDWRRVHAGLATRDSKTVLSIFRKCVLSELEDLADNSKEGRRRFDVPFCVACASPDTLETPIEGGIKLSSVDYAAKAIDFVRSSGLLPKVEDSGAAIQLAISAFGRLIGKKFEAEEIEVTVVSSRRHGIPSIKDLGISEIADNLAIINNASETVV